MPSVRLTDHQAAMTAAVAVCSTNASRTVTGVFALPECCAAELGSSLPTFPDNLSVPSQWANSTTVNCEECHCPSGRPAVSDGQCFVSFGRGALWRNLGTGSLKPSGCYMYRTVVTICTASLTVNNSTVCPHSVFMCFVWISEQTAIISLYNINWLVCITDRECVYCTVRTGSLCIT
jgi:hypothetical protein